MQQFFEVGGFEERRGTFKRGNEVVW